MSKKTRKVGEMGPEEAQAFAAGYAEALQDYAPDAELLAAQASEIRNLQRRLTTAQGDLDELNRTVDALQAETAGYFEQLRELGVFDAELLERNSAYHARQRRNLQRVTARLQEQRPDYRGGPIRWPEPQ
jgi:hypothetical protein